VMPEAFVNPGEPVDLWTPARPATTGEGGGANYGVIARVREDRTWMDATGELKTLGRAFFETRPHPEGTSRWFSLVSMQDTLTAGTREPLTMLAGAVGLVLLIACVNLAALL